MPHHHWQSLHPHWHHYYKRYNMFYGPSRLVWFAFGSVATWAYIRHHHYHHHQGAACPPRVGYGYNTGPGRAQWEERDQSPPNNNNNSNNNNNNNASSSSSSSSSPAGRGDYGQWRPTQPPTQTQSGSESMTPMDLDHERLREIGRSAEETISGMSEATIDSMMGALQRLKNGLAERRGQQQLQEIGPQRASPTAATSPEEPTGPRHRV